MIWNSARPVVLLDKIRGDSYRSLYCHTFIGLG